MAKPTKSKSKKKKAYLSKRALIRATRKGTRSIASEAMKIKGYTIEAQDGWVVKIHDSGERERISRLNRSGLIVVD